MHIHTQGWTHLKKIMQIRGNCRNQSGAIKYVPIYTYTPFFFMNLRLYECRLFD